MERILVDEEWYYPVAKDLLLEAEFESQILANAVSLFPGFTTLKFNRTLRSAEYGNSAPDFLLIDKYFRSWWIVEVEMSRHSLRQHVEPQVASLSHAAFTTADIAYVIQSADPDAADAVTQLIENVQPNVLVIVDDTCIEWPGALKAYEASVVTVRPFQSRQGKFVFQQIGEIPGIETSVLSSVLIKRDLGRALVVENRAALPFEQGHQIELFIEESPTKWRCHFVGGTLMLFCLEGRFPFESSAGHYRLIQRTTGELAIEKHTVRIIKDTR